MDGDEVLGDETGDAVVGEEIVGAEASGDEGWLVAVEAGFDGELKALESWCWLAKATKDVGDEANLAKPPPAALPKPSEVAGTPNPDVVIVCVPRDETCPNTGAAGPPPPGALPKARAGFGASAPTGASGFAESHVNEALPKEKE